MVNDFKVCQIYLGILIDSHLKWPHRSDLLSTELSRSIGMLSKSGIMYQENILRAIYFGIYSLLTYASQICVQTQNKYINRIENLQNNAVRIINFAYFHHSVKPLYYKSKILKLQDSVKIQNFIYVFRK